MNDKDLDDILDDALKEFEDDLPPRITSIPQSSSSTSSSSINSSYQFSSLSSTTSYTTNSSSSKTSSQLPPLSSLPQELQQKLFTNEAVTENQKGKSPATGAKTNTATIDQNFGSNLLQNDGNVDIEKAFEEMSEEEKKVMNDFANEMKKFFADIEMNQNETPQEKQNEPKSDEETTLKDSIENTLRLLSQGSKQGDPKKLDDPNAEEPEQLKEILNMFQNLTTSAGAEQGEGSTEENEEESDKMYDVLEKIMATLMSPDVLKEPMAQLKQKYPAYLEKYKDTLSKEEFQRISSQYDYASKICNVYETQTYPASLPQLIELMKGMQSCGQPPEEIVQELNSDGGMGNLPDPSKCPMQ